MERMAVGELIDRYAAGERDFTGVNLRNANLEGVYLKHANLKGANLDGARLDGSDLRMASLDGAQLGGVSLNDANLEKASLKGAVLGGSFQRKKAIFGNTSMPDGSISNEGCKPTVSAKFQSD